MEMMAMTTVTRTRPMRRMLMILLVMTTMMEEIVMRDLIEKIQTTSEI